MKKTLLFFVILCASFALTGCPKSDAPVEGDNPIAEGATTLENNPNADQAEPSRGAPPEGDRSGGKG